MSECLILFLLDMIFEWVWDLITICTDIMKQRFIDVANYRINLCLNECQHVSSFSDQNLIIVWRLLHELLVKKLIELFKEEHWMFSKNNWTGQLHCWILKNSTIMSVIRSISVKTTEVTNISTTTARTSWMLSQLDMRQWDPCVAVFAGEVSQIWACDQQVCVWIMRYLSSSWESDKYLSDNSKEETNIAVKEWETVQIICCQTFEQKEARFMLLLWSKELCCEYVEERWRNLRRKTHYVIKNMTFYSD